jgi:lipopolysaccharide transport system permease protein
MTRQITLTHSAGRVPTRVYTPEPLLSHPLVLFRDMFTDLWAARKVAWRLLVRDISGQYRQTWLGYAWVLLTPLAASLTFIFLSSQGIVSVKTEMPYPAFVFIGTLLWQVFADALQSPISVFNSAKSTLTKINFPREGILMAGLGMVTFNFLVRLVLFIGVLAYYRVPVAPSLLLLPVGVIGLMACGTALGLAITPIGALYGDIGRAMPIVTGFWMLLTPVVYPARSTGIAGTLATWNPVSPLIVTARQFVTGQPLTFFPEWLVVFSGSIAACFLGWIAFRLAMPHLIARMGG